MMEKKQAGVFNPQEDDPTINNWDNADSITIHYPDDGLENHGETIHMQKTALLRLGRLCIFNQVRDGTNPEQDGITESIGRTGLLNAIDVVRIPKKAVDEYAQFIYELWGGEKVDTSKLPKSSFAPRMYDVVVAGHSRVIGLKFVEEETARFFWAMGKPSYNPDMVRVHAKLYHASSIADMIKIQINENIHKAPSEERVAMLLVENYYLGLRDGLWKNTAGFQAEYADKFNQKRVRDAVAFSKLPSTIRDLIFAKLIPYNVGILLGNYTEVLYEFNAFKYFKGKKREQLTMIQKAKLDSNIESELMKEAILLINKRLRFTPARAHYMALKKAKEEVMRGEKTMPSFGADIFEKSAIADMEKATRRNRDLVNRALDEMVDTEMNKMLLTQVLIGRLAKRKPKLNRFLEGVEKIAGQTRAVINT